MTVVSDSIDYPSMIKGTQYGPLINATKVLGRWAYVMPRIEAISSLVKLVADGGELTVEVADFGEITFSLRMFGLDPRSVSVMLDLKDESAGITHVFVLGFLDSDPSKDTLGPQSRINWLGSFTTEDEEFSLYQQIRPKLARAAQ